MDVSQLVLRIVRGTLNLVPDHAVPENPALLVGHGDGHAPRNAHQGFLLVGVTDVEPERTGRLENTPHLAHDHQQVLNVLVERRFQANPATSIRSVPPVRRGSDAAVRHTLREMPQGRARHYLQSATDEQSPIVNKSKALHSLPSPRMNYSFLSVLCRSSRPFLASYNVPVCVGETSGMLLHYCSFLSSHAFFFAFSRCSV